MSENIKINRDGSIDIMAKDGIMFMPTGRNVRSFANKYELEKEFGNIDHIEDLGDYIKIMDI